MAYLDEGKKHDLLVLANELDISVSDTCKIIEIRDAILKSSTYDEEFTRELFSSIVDERKQNEERLHELEKLKLQAKQKVLLQALKIKEYQKNRSQEQFKNLNSGPQKTKAFYTNPRSEMKNDDRPQVSCYGCGEVGVIKPKCPNCSPPSRVDSIEFSSVQLCSCSLQQQQRTLLKISINDMNGVACADTGASHTFASEVLYNLLKEKGTRFETTTMKVTLADGIERETEVHHAQVNIIIQRRVIRTDLFALPTAKDNRTLLGIDFLRKARIVLDVSNRKWFFSNKPKQKFAFAEDTFRRIPKSPNAIVDANSVLVDSNSVHLRNDEDEHITKNQRIELNGLIETFSDVFRPGEEATPKIQHYINTGNNPPVLLPPAKKEILQKELNKLLANNTLEECESPYASPVEFQSLNLKYVPEKANAVADMLSRPFCQHQGGTCEICAISMDMPTRSSSDIREEQLKDGNLQKSIVSFERAASTPVAPIRRRGRPGKPRFQRDRHPPAGGAAQAGVSDDDKRPSPESVPHERLKLPNQRIQPPRRATRFSRTIEAG